jgi:hypothetical protein
LLQVGTQGHEAPLHPLMISAYTTKLACFVKLIVCWMKPAV